MAANDETSSQKLENVLIIRWRRLLLCFHACGVVSIWNASFVITPRSLSSSRFIHLFCFVFLFFQLFRWINFYFHIFWMLKSVYFPPAPCYYLPLGQINSRRSYEYSNLMVVYFWKYLTQSPIYLKNYFPVSSISLWYH